MTQILQEETYKYIPGEETDDIVMSIDWMAYLLEIFKLCEYCAGKMLSNKENVRSVGNSVNVQATPDCIKNLNKFKRGCNERALKGLQQ